MKLHEVFLPEAPVKVNVRMVIRWLDRMLVGGGQTEDFGRLARGKKGFVFDDKDPALNQLLGAIEDLEQSDERLAEDDPDLMRAIDNFEKRAKGRAVILVADKKGKDLFISVALVNTNKTADAQRWVQDNIIPEVQKEFPDTKFEVVKAKKDLDLPLSQASELPVNVTDFNVTVSLD